MENDDKDIWEEVKRTIKPLKGKGVARAGMKGKIAPKSKTEIKEKVKAAPPPSPPSPLPAKQIRKLRRQDIPVEATLDLHGMTVEKAHGAFTRFLGRARQKNLRCVEVITGRGDPIRGTGQLRRNLPLWLEMESGILHTEQNPKSRGGSYLIMLRRTRK